MSESYGAIPFDGIFKADAIKLFSETLLFGFRIRMILIPEIFYLFQLTAVFRYAVVILMAHKPFDFFSVAGRHYNDGTVRARLYADPEMDKYFPSFFSLGRIGYHD